MEQLELISICSAESADSPSRADGQESKPSHSAKSKNTLSESSEKTFQEFGYSKTFGNFQQLNFASLSCLPEATRASLSAKPGSVEARKMTATSGRRCLELSEHRGRLGYSLKMLLDTLRWASTKCLLTWKAKNTPCNRLLFQLAPWTPRTDEIESGLWLGTPKATQSIRSEKFRKGRTPTPEEFVMWATPNATPRGAHTGAKAGEVSENGKTRTSSNGTKWGATLETQVARSLWATPRSNAAMSGTADVMKTANHKFPNLETQVARSLLPTPIADDAKNVNPKENRFPTLTSKVKATEGSGALNPTWVEWLMGYPEGWTDCEDSETQLSRKSPTKSLKP